MSTDWHRVTSPGYNQHNRCSLFSTTICSGRHWQHVSNHFLSWGTNYSIKLFLWCTSFFGMSLSVASTTNINCKAHCYMQRLKNVTILNFFLRHLWVHFKLEKLQWRMYAAVTTWWLVAQSALQKFLQNWKRRHVVNAFWFFHQCRSKLCSQHLSISTHLNVAKFLEP